MNPQFALSRKNAAASLDMGLTTFEERVQPGLAVIRVGSKVLIPVAELERWTRENAARALGGGR